MRKFDKNTGIFIFEKEDQQFFDKGLTDGIVNLFKPTQTADLGCSQGLYCRYLYENGFDVDGYEGADLNGLAKYHTITKMDLSKPQNPMMYPLVLCLEVAEHIPAERERVFINNLCQFVGNTLIISWSNKSGAEGSGHVNCKSPKQVEKLLRNRNMKLNREKTEHLRRKATIKWFKNVMVYDRK